MGSITIHKDHKWEEVQQRIRAQFNQEPDVKTALFLVGLRETGRSKGKLKKEEKMDLMNIAFCRVVSESGYFTLAGKDAKGWPVYEQVKPIPDMKSSVQEQFIRDHIIIYFQKENLI
ncbi:MAG: hypothetical protein WD077_14210 [Bacteroidia bacterium]